MGADLTLDLDATTAGARRAGRARRDPRRRRRRGDRGGRRRRGDSAKGSTWRASAAATSSPGTTPTSAPSTINAHQQINRKHLEIRGCWGSEARHFLRALSILERHPSIPFREIGARRYGLDQLNDALADAEAMRIPKALVDPWQ